MARGLVLHCVGMMLVVAALAGSSFADNVTIDEDLYGMAGITVTHEDADPFKGYVYVAMSNFGSTPWGDFHFQILPCMGSDVSSVDIAAMPAPTTDRNPFSYVIDNNAVGSTLDYYFYSDPVDYGETATFTFYTDNTAKRVNFCLFMCPTPMPVPEPTMLSLLGFGLAAMMLTRRRR